MAINEKIRREDAENGIRIGRRAEKGVNHEQKIGVNEKAEGIGSFLQKDVFIAGMEFVNDEGVNDEKGVRDEGKRGQEKRARHADPEKNDG